MIYSIFLLIRFYIKTLWLSVKIYAVNKGGVVVSIIDGFRARIFMLTVLTYNEQLIKISTFKDCCTFIACNTFILHIKVDRHKGKKTVKIFTII